MADQTYVRDEDLPHLEMVRVLENLSVYDLRMRLFRSNWALNPNPKPEARTPNPKPCTVKRKHSEPRNLSRNLEHPL